MDISALAQLKGLVKDGFSRSIQRHRDARDLHLWNYMTARSGWRRLIFGLHVAAAELRKHLLLTNTEFEYHLARNNSDHEIFRANRQRLRELRLHVSVMSTGEIFRHARRVARSYNAWELAKRTNDFSRIEKPFGALLRMMKDIAGRKMRLLGLSDPYEALVDEQTPGLRLHQIESYVAELETFCAPALRRVRDEQGKTFNLPEASAWAMPREQQKRLAALILEAMGFDLKKGTLGESEHPICVGHRDDVRIGLNFDEDDFIKTVLDTLHEGGHALYRQNLPRMWHWHPVGNIPSQSIDESMALLMENGIGRTREFSAFLYRALTEQLGFAPAFTAEQLYQRLVRLEPSPIRAYADELRYPLDLILRYKVTRDLFEGHTSVKDIPAQWNQLTLELCGLEVRSDTEGCLQDVHIYSGQIGYFMNYLVGVLAANQFMATVRKDNPGLMAEIGRGDFSTLKAWLNHHIYRHGAKYDTFVLIERVSREPLSARSYKQNMISRYLSTPPARGGSFMQRLLETVKA